MVRRDRASAEVSVHELVPAARVGAQGEAETRIVYALRGAVPVEVDDELLALSANGALVATGATRFAITAAAEGAAAIVVALGPPGRFAAPA